MSEPPSKSWIRLAVASGATAAGLAALRALGRRIGRYLDDRAPVRVKRVFLHQTLLLRLDFARGDSRLLLLVEPRTFTPVAVGIPRIGTGWSYLARAQRRDLVRPELRL